MSKFHTKQVAELQVEGRFLDWIFKDGYKLKGIRLETSQGLFFVKLAKELRYGLELQLTPGDWIQVIGTQELDLRKGKLKLKADRVFPVSSENTALPYSEVSSEYQRTQNRAETPVPAKPEPAKTHASILVCQKSDCVKRGGRAVCNALSAALSDRGLSDRVTIKTTGCLKQCSSGPNVVVMPDRTRYNWVNAAQIPELIDKHFPVRNEIGEV